MLVEACVLFYTSRRCTTCDHNSFDESILNAWMHKQICGRIVFIAPQLHTPKWQLLATQYVPFKYIHHKGGAHFQKHICMWKGVCVVQECTQEGIRLSRMWGWPIQKAGQDTSLVKVIRYFPLIPRLVRWYKSPNCCIVKWHAMHKSTYGLVRHIMYSNACKHFTTMMGEFGRRVMDIVIGAMDGVNPFPTKLCKWSTWPAFAFGYNLPPWMTIKQFLCVNSGANAWSKIS